MRAVKRVLIVDDEELLLKSLIRTMKAQGEYTILTATTVKEALRVIQAEDAPVDLVISDYCLPDGTTEDILAKVTSLKLIPLLIVMSGMAVPQQTFHLGQSGVAAFLTKPFSNAALEAALGKARNYKFQVPLMAASCVGNDSIRNLADAIRIAMTAQAVAMSNGNRTRAAMLLKIARQSLSADK